MAVSVAEIANGLCITGAPVLPVANLTIASARAALWSGRLNCSGLVAAYINRINAYDQRTGLNSVLTINSQATMEAARMDSMLVHLRSNVLKNGTTTFNGSSPMSSIPLPPLFCVPLLVKDNYDVAKMPATAGSIGLAGNIPDSDAQVIARLRAAGAIVLAKSNMGEFAFFPSYCVSSIAGTVRNPYDLGHTPAGSSGGSAAGVAAGFAIAALGTDTGNSVRGPASHTALVGLRPSLGLIGRSGIVPLRFDRDTAGPLARTVADVATLLSVMVGFDPGDNLTTAIATNNITLPIDYTQFLDGGALRGARIGVFRSIADLDGTDPDIAMLFYNALQDMVNAGADLSDDFRIVGNTYGVDWDANRGGQGPALGFWNVNGTWQDLWACQSPLRIGFDAYMAKRNSSNPNVPRTLQSLYNAGLFHPAALDDLSASVNAIAPPDEFSTTPANGIPPGSGAKIIRGTACGCGVLSTDFCRVEFRKRLIESMNNDGVDVVIYPTWNMPPLRLGDPGDGYYDGNNSPMIAPHVGAPAITVPMGLTPSGMPAGLQILGRPFDEPTVIKIAYAYEQATRHRTAPELFRECVTAESPSQAPNVAVPVAGRRRS